MHSVIHRHGNTHWCRSSVNVYQNHQSHDLHSWFQQLNISKHPMVSHRNHPNKYLIDSLIPKIRKISYAKICQHEMNFRIWNFHGCGNRLYWHNPIICFTKKVFHRVLILNNHFFLSLKCLDELKTNFKNFQILQWKLSKPNLLVTSCSK